MDSHQKIIPPKKALMWLMIFTMLISGTAALALLYYHYIRSLYANDENYTIIALLQTTNEKEGLKSIYLTELLNLSVDHPTNLYQFNSKEGRKKLLASSLIRDAKIRKIRPGMLRIDYDMRKPIAFLIDYENTVIDNDWVSFPFKPFFTPKRLPEIYLGISLPNAESKISGGLWGTPIQGERVDLAKKILSHINKYYVNDIIALKKIDVANAFASSYGQREVIVVFEGKFFRQVDEKPYLLKFSHILRLDTEKYLQGLANYSILQSKLLTEEKDLEAFATEDGTAELPTQIIDLRLPQLAFIQAMSDEQ